MSGRHPVVPVFRRAAPRRPAAACGGTCSARTPRPAGPVFDVVAPAIALRFGALTAAYRVRLLDRVLGLDALPGRGGPGR